MGAMACVASPGIFWALHSSATGVVHISPSCSMHGKERVARLLRTAVFVLLCLCDRPPDAICRSMNDEAAVWAMSQTRLSHRWKQSKSCLLGRRTRREELT